MTKKTTLGLALLALLACALVSAGCGGDDDDTDADGDVDSNGRVFVLSSDFVTSVYGWLALRDLSTFHELGPAEGDAVAARAAGRMFVLERTLGAATLLDGNLSIERNFSVADEDGPAPNPHDVALTSDHRKAYVARFNQGTLAIVDPATGAITGTIDLSSHDPDGVPDMDAIVIAGGPAGERAWVSLELLDETFLPRGNGEVVVIDAATDEVLETIPLPVANPYGRFRNHGVTGNFLLPCPGVFGVQDGGIVEIDPASNEATLLLGEEALGGDVGSFVVADATHGFAIVARDFVTYLVPFDPSTGTVGDPIVSSEGWDLRDLELVDHTLVVADGATNTPGLRFFDLEGRELTDAPVDVGLPPATVLALP